MHRYQFPVPERFPPVPGTDPNGSPVPTPLGGNRELTDRTTKRFPVTATAGLHSPAHRQPGEHVTTTLITTTPFGVGGRYGPLADHERRAIIDYQERTAVLADTVDAPSADTYRQLEAEEGRTAALHVIRSDRATLGEWDREWCELHYEVHYRGDHTRPATQSSEAATRYIDDARHTLEQRIHQFYSAVVSYVLGEEDR